MLIEVKLGDLGTSTRWVGMQVMLDVLQVLVVGGLLLVVEALQQALVKPGKRLVVMQADRLRPSEPFVHKESLLPFRLHHKGLVQQKEALLVT